VKGATPPSLAAVQARVPWAQVDRVVVVPRLPMDRRHNAKVDYPALGRLLAGRLERNNKPFGS
jgi:olefin beta-lactone synthetase